MENTGAMIQRSYSAAEDSDILAITHQRGTFGRNVITTTFPIAILLFLGVYFFRRSLLAATVIATVFFLASFFSNLLFFRKVQRRENQKQDSMAVEVLEISASHVLEIEPFGDIAPAFCFFVNETQALLLVGQWLMDYNEFPCESFRLYRWADSLKPIRIESIGRPLKAAPSTVRLLPKYRFKEIQLIEAKPERLQEDLDRALS